MSDFWATDTDISLPDVNDPKTPIQVDFGGFAFTALGMTHKFSDGDREQIMQNRYAPKGKLPNE